MPQTCTTFLMICTLFSCSFSLLFCLKQWKEGLVGDLWVMLYWNYFIILFMEKVYDPKTYVANKNIRTASCIQPRHQGMLEFTLTGILFLLPLLCICKFTGNDLEQPRTLTFLINVIKVHYQYSLWFWLLKCIISIILLPNTKAIDNKRYNSGCKWECGRGGILYSGLYHDDCFKINGLRMCCLITLRNTLCF